MLRHQFNRKSMTTYISYTLLICLLVFSVTTTAQNNSPQQTTGSTSFISKQLSNNNSSPDAKAMYRYIQSISGEKILTGQMYSSSGTNSNEYGYILAGKTPAIYGIDMDTEMANETQIQNTIEQYKTGAIPLITWDWQRLSIEDNTTTTSQEVNVARCFQEGTAEHEAFLKDLEKVARRLAKLNNAGVPVLWNPLSDTNNKSFWWSNQNPDQFKKIWQTMFNYFTLDSALNNLIWIQSFGEDTDLDQFAGNNYVDMIRVNWNENSSKSHFEVYDKVREITTGFASPVIFVNSTGMPPVEQWSTVGTSWCWWIEDPGTLPASADNKNLYQDLNDKIIITSDEVANLITYFGEEGVKRQYFRGSKIPFSDLKEFNLGTESRKISNNNRLEVFVEGKGKNDEYFFAFKQLTGDFDVSVQATNLSPAKIQALAGIMVRTNLSKKSPYVFYHFKTGINEDDADFKECGLIFRSKKVKNTQSVSINPLAYKDLFSSGFTNTWIRLKRRGNIFKSYISEDNTHWHLYSVYEQQMPEYTLVGLAVSSKNTRESVQIEFTDMELTWE